MTRRVIVFGRGIFGTSLRQYLRRLGIASLVGGRQPGCDVVADLEERTSMLSAFQPGDVLVDAAGPFDLRSTALVECAAARACDIVDINEQLDHARTLRGMDPELAQAGIRVLPSSSSASVLSCALVRLMEVAPTSVSVLLLPAVGVTTSTAMMGTLIRTLRRPIRVLRSGALTEAPSWSVRRRFALPGGLGDRQGRLFESADVVWLPDAWPDLQSVDFWIDSGALSPPGMLLRAAARIDEALLVAPAVALARRFGRRWGGLAVAVRSSCGKTVTRGWWSESDSHMMAVVPAALAVKKLIAGDDLRPGVVPPSRQVPMAELMDHLDQVGVRQL